MTTHPLHPPIENILHPTPPLLLPVNVPKPFSYLRLKNETAATKRALLKSMHLIY